MDTRDKASTIYQVWRIANQPDTGDAERAAHKPDGLKMPVSRATGAPNGAAALWGMGLLIGAAAMYLLDAENGERRRAEVARRVDQYRDEVERTIERDRERALGQLRGTAREALRRARESLLPDETIRREIDARMEEVLPFEEAAQIRVSVRRGRVALDGAVAEAYLNRLLGRIATAPGVRGLDNRLVVRPSTSNRRGGGADDPLQG